ncbi:MAG: hypothetical protein JNK45_26580 [Myxococcales bacterium]|nr:hypothetical protein [Myxococcales bacterium]
MAATNARVLGCVALAATACQGPAADVLAIWVDAAVQDDGARAIQIYDAGERRSVELRPTIAGSDTGQIGLGVAPGGGGFAVSSVKGGTVWIDLDRGTRGQIALGPWGELAADFAFSRSGRAILRSTVDEIDPGAVLMPISTAQTTPLWVHGPELEHPGSRVLIRSASAAPIVYWAELPGADANGGVQSVDGTVVAFEYPADDRRTPLTSLVELGGTRMHTRAIDESAFPNRIGSNSAWCLGGFCVTPDGDAAIGISPTVCDLLRFEWARKGSDGESRPARKITLPLGCGAPSEPHLLAALDASHVLLDDDERIYLADLDRDLWTAVPKLGAGRQIFMLPADGGRTMNLVSVTGAVIRADADGLRVVSAERIGCNVRGTPQSSPGGEWILMTCEGEVPMESAVDLDVALATTVRISSLGLERYDGLAMAPLGIDDGGNALLYSYDPDDNEEVPRGLFVLEASGDLSRVDELEPTPEAFRGASGLPYFAAAARSR